MIVKIGHSFNRIYKNISARNRFSMNVDVLQFIILVLFAVGGFRVLIFAFRIMLFFVKFDWSEDDNE